MPCRIPISAAGNTKAETRKAPAADHRQLQADNSIDLAAKAGLGSTGTTMGERWAIIDR